MATTLSFWIFIPKSPKLQQVRLGAADPDNLSSLLALLAGSRDWQSSCLPASPDGTQSPRLFPYNCE